MDLRRTVSSKSEDTAYLIDIIDFVHAPGWKEKNFLAEKYVTEGRFVAQIAEETFSSRATVRKALIGFGIKLRQRRKPG